jgi:hypothetical protein
MRTEWLAMEHYRMHLIEEWPDGPRKEAGLASVRSALESLLRSSEGEPAFTCAICGAAPHKPGIVIPFRTQAAPEEIKELAA